MTALSFPFSHSLQESKLMYLPKCQISTQWHNANKYPKFCWPVRLTTQRASFSTSFAMCLWQHWKLHIYCMPTMTISVWHTCSIRVYNNMTLGQTDSLTSSVSCFYLWRHVCIHRLLHRLHTWEQQHHKSLLLLRVWFASWIFWISWPMKKYGQSGQSHHLLR